MDEFVAGGLAEGVVDPAVQIRQCAKDVILLQTWGN
jgi:hypothetical protein